MSCGRNPRADQHSTDKLFVPVAQAAILAEINCQPVYCASACAVGDNYGEEPQLRSVTEKQSRSSSSEVASPEADQVEQDEQEGATPPQDAPEELHRPGKRRDHAAKNRLRKLREENAKIDGACQICLDPVDPQSLSQGGMWKM